MSRFRWTKLMRVQAFVAAVTLFGCGFSPGPECPSGRDGGDSGFSTALVNGCLANEGFRRSRRYVDGWLRHADPKTGLIPRNLRENYWNAQDCAADNYSFMVLTAALTDRELYEGRMRDMLRTETRLTSRIDRLPDTYSFSKQAFAFAEPDLGRIIFGASEYVKDGLLPITEWLGPSPWSERMITILDDIWKHAPVETPHGRIVSTSVEVNGEMLQALPRVYWMTGDRKYLNWAIRLGDYYLMGRHHPTRDLKTLSLRDHGCEIISGLCELYATLHFAQPTKAEDYRGPVHEMLDRILEVGRNSHGLFYNMTDPRQGTAGGGIADTWGYTLNGLYTVYLVDGTEAYRMATLKALGCLNEHYRGYRWGERGSDGYADFIESALNLFRGYRWNEKGSDSDGYADSIEGALNLFNRERVSSSAEWMDSEIRVMWRKQKSDGVIEGLHVDGNFARTTIMYCLWKTKGLSIRPWREDVVFGAVQEGTHLKIAMRAERPWKGRLIFDAPRHRAHLNLPIDWPRINQFPEWFVVRPGERYKVRDVTVGSEVEYPADRMRAGVVLELEAGIERWLLVEEASGGRVPPEAGLAIPPVAGGFEPRPRSQPSLVLTSLGRVPDGGPLF